MTTEIWKIIPDTDSNYTVSSNGEVFSVRAARLLRPGKASNGYLTVCITRNGKRVSTPVQWLVAEAFHGPRPDGAFVLHNDGDKSNNVATNLRYGSRSDNAQDIAFHGGRKLSVDQVKAIRALFTDGRTGTSIAREFEITHEQAYQIKNGKAYAYVR